MRTLRRTLGLAIAAVLVCAGALFAVQGLGYVEGSEMTDVGFWAIVGPLMAGFGLALGIVILQKR